MMDIARPTWPVTERDEARKAIGAMLTKCTQLFRRSFTAEDADAHMPFFETALLGDGDRPEFTADEIAEGFVRWMSKHKHHTAPMPAEIVGAIELMPRGHSGRTYRSPAADCDLCDDAGFVMVGRQHSFYGESQRRCAVRCPHDRAELSAMAHRGGWRVPVLGDVGLIDDRDFSVGAAAHKVVEDAR